MRIALNLLADELRRLKASGVERVAVSDEGIEALRRSLREPPPAAGPGPSPKPVPAPSAAPAAAPPVVALPEGDKAARWAALLQAVLDDPVCKSKVRPGKRAVLGVGSLDAAIMFVGEAPGAEEEIQGEPFVGPAGQLLNRMIVGMGLSRAEVYIGNILNWRPDLPVGPDGVQTGNRPPTESEMAHCLPYLRAQVEIVDPRLLVALGATAAKGLLGSRAFGALSEVRGRWHDLGGRPLMVTYHPSYVLRNPTNRTKRLIWEDLLKVMERANLPISEKQRRFFL
ncbi:MAG TPA: uracil-DNA glycosylase [Opitutaceae bacterium]|nr:uracil-DNA glycosylase [Opitutaceae bacterium]